MEASEVSVTDIALLGLHFHQAREIYTHSFIPSVNTYSVQFSCSAAAAKSLQSYPTLCDPMDCSIPGFPVHNQLPELAQTHVHRVSDAIQPCHPLPSIFPASGSFQMSQSFASGGQNIGVSASASVLPMNTQD